MLRQESASQEAEGKQIVAKTTNSIKTTHLVVFFYFWDIHEKSTVSEKPRSRARNSQTQQLCTEAMLRQESASQGIGKKQMVAKTTNDIRMTHLVVFYFWKIHGKSTVSEEPRSRARNNQTQLVVVAKTTNNTKMIHFCSLLPPNPNSKHQRKLKGFRKNLDLEPKVPSQDTAGTRFGGCQKTTSYQDNKSGSLLPPNQNLKHQKNEGFRRNLDLEPKNSQEHYRFGGCQKNNNLPRQ